MEHSKLPWRVMELKNDCCIQDANHDETSVADRIKTIDAEFIVEACNSYEKLQQTNKELIEAFKIAFELLQQGEDICGYEGYWEKVRETEQILNKYTKKQI